MTTLSVVIPAYNEEKGIETIVRRVLNIKKSLLEVGIEQLEVLVVNDGSKDRTAEIVRNIEGVRLITYSPNQGYGAALKNGFNQASGELIGFLDADGTYPPEYFPQLCQKALDGSDLVVGSRMAGAESKMPVTRRVGNLFFAFLLSLVSRQHVTDSASGMRVFRREILEQVYPLPNGLNMTPVMSTRAIHEGIHIVEVSIPYSERLGRSKLNVVQDGSIFLQSILWTALAYNPVRILGLIGLGGMAVGLIALAGLTYARLRGITVLHPWEIASLFWGAVSGVTGISIFALGSTFNYLVSLFYKKPIQQGLFGHPIFKPSLDRYFGWLGTGSFVAGLAIGLASVTLGINGWDMSRLWLYLLGSAMLILMGVQLIIYWILMRVLENLSQRELLTKQDFGIRFGSKDFIDTAQTQVNAE
jgi:glycosyltransferase involved in cell wall biosynthesis